MSAVSEAAETKTHPGSAVEVLRIFTRLGLTSFGGPVAHLGYFRAEFVERRKWLDEAHYLDIVALCQFLPGPASSQTGITLGILRAGLPGAFAAWIGFSGPSVLAMILHMGLPRSATSRMCPGYTASRSLPLRWSLRPCGAWRAIYVPTENAPP